jgi:hypothetical protein
MGRTPAGLIVNVSREERLRAIDAFAEKMETGEPGGEALERELRSSVDDRIRVVRISPRAGDLPPRVRAPGVIPGLWHVKLLTHPRNAYFPIAGPDWQYREPDLAFVEELKARDLWRRGALEEIRKGEEEDERARIRQELLEAEQREDEVALAFRAAKRVNGEGGLFRRTDRKGVRPDQAAVAGFSERSEGGLLIPSGAN